MTSPTSDLASLLSTLTSYRAEKEAIYNKKLDTVDLTLAGIDREKRKLRKERTRVERELDDVEAGIRLAQDSAIPVVFLAEQTELQNKLNELDLTLARLARKWKELKKEKKAIERAWSCAGPLAF